MAIEIINGDLLDAFEAGEVNVIAHCCNAQKVMGSGLALQVKNRYPQAYTEYVDHLTKAQQWYRGPVGTTNVVKLGQHEDGWRDKKIYNLIGQEFYGTGNRQVNYGAISQCLCAMSTGLTGNRDVVVQDYDDIGFPYKMASDRGGADWNIILEMIEFYFKNHNVRIYKL